MVKVREGMALIMFLCSATMVYHIVGDPKRDGRSERHASHLAVHAGRRSMKGLAHVSCCARRCWSSSQAKSRDLWSPE